MTVTANTTRNDYVGNGQSVYDYTFQLHDASDLAVYLDGYLQTLNTHYTVSGVGNSSGGTIEFTLYSNGVRIHPTSSNTIILAMQMDLDRDTNYQQSGFFASSDVNNDFDRLWLATNQQQTRLDRSINIPVNDVTRSMALPFYNERANKVLAFDSNGAVIVGPLVSDTNTIAGISSDISTVAGISANVTTVSGIAPNVTTVAGISSDVTTVAGLNASHLGTVATNINSVNTVATNASDVVSVAGKITEVETVADDLDLGANSLVKEVADDLALGNSSLIKEVADNMTDVTNASNLVTATVATGSEGTNVTYNANTGVLTVPRGATGNTGPTGLTGATGDGFTGGSYDPSTGRITFTSDDGLGFFTSDVRGAASTVPGPTGPTGPQGAQGIQGNQGDQGDGWTGASYNANDGTVTFTSIDGLGFQTGDLRGVKGDTGSDGPEGPDGPQGPQGIEGPQGEQGAAGPAGASATAAGSLVYNGSTKLQAYSNGINVNVDVSLPDNGKLLLGASDDLQIYHNGNASLITDTGTGDLFIRASNALRLQSADNENYLVANANGSLNLYHNNAEKLATTSTGIDVTGGIVIDTNPSGHSVDEAIRIDDGGSTVDRALQLFEYHDTGARYHSISFNTHTTSNGSNFVYTQGNYGGSSSIQFANAGNISFFTDNQVTSGSTTNITPSERFRITSGGNVGIGTTSPERKLHVQGSGGTIAAKIEATDGRQSSLDLKNSEGEFRLINDGGELSVYDQTDNTERFRIDTNGNVGIGTSSPATKLEINGDIGIGRVAGGYTFREVVGGGERASMKSNALNDLVFSIGASTEAMRIEATQGKVGIGTTSPDTTLDVHSSTNGHGIYIAQDNAGYGYHTRLTFQGSNGSGGYNTIASLKAYQETNGTNGYLRFDTNGDNERMRITPSGNVGIGTSSPATTLEVKSNATNDFITLQHTSGPKSYIGNSSVGSLILSADEGNSGNTSRIEMKVDGTERMRIDSSGKVGIGTTSPQDALHIKSSSTDARLLLDGHTNFDAELKFAENGSVKYTVGHDAATDSFRIGTTNVDTNPRLVIASSGNVGIGTTSPTGSLTVFNSVAPSIKLQNNTSGSATGDGLQFYVSGATGYIDHKENGSLNFNVNASERMRIDSSGNLLVGTTDNTLYNNTTGGGANILADGLTTIARQTATTADTVFVLNDTGAGGSMQEFRKDGTTVGSIGTISNDLTIGSTDTRIRFDDNGAITPRNSSDANSDATIDLGQSGGRFKDLHLSGRSYSDSASIGTTSTSYKLHVDAPANSLACRIEGVKTSSTGNEMLSLVNKSTSGASNGYFVTMYGSDSNGAVLRGALGLNSNPGGSQYSIPYLAHTSGTGLACAYSGASAYNGIYPCTNTGASNSGVPNLGTAAVKWNTVYATNSTINTSDRTEKQDIEALSDAETRVAVAVKGLLRKYRFISAVAEKGDNARIHFGIIAQDLQAAFEVEGLDAGKYAMFCSDTWYEHEGEAYPTQEEAPEGATEITKLGVRYSELLAFIISAI